MELNTHHRLSQAAFWYSAFPAIVLAFIAVIAGAFMRDIVASACMESACPAYMPFVVPSIVIVFIVVALIQPVLNFILFSYSLNASSITINSGILYRQYETIDFNRIQTLDLERGPLLWLFGLTEVHLWTASAGQLNHDESSAHANADTVLLLDRDTAELLREHLHTAKAPVQPPPSPAPAPAPVFAPAAVAPSSSQAPNA